MIAIDGEESIGRHLRKVMLMEAIGKIADDKQRFAIQKRLEGYPSKAIAILLQKKWQKEGIVVYNNKNEIVVPNEHYVNVLIQRAKQELREIMVELK
jgi:DNA-directed RNA polymerase specialized sigma24 family protein